jgi:hypothetical protein
MDADREAQALLAPLKHEPAPLSGLDVAGLVVAGQRRIRARRWTGAGAAVATAIALVPASLAMLDRPADTSQPTAAQPSPTGTTTVTTAVKPPEFPVSCTARLLSAPPGVASTSVVSGDPTGRYLVGGYADAQGNNRPLLWDNGALVVLDAPGQDNSSIVVNENGVVAGTSTTVIEGVLSFYNWMYRDGRFDLVGEVGQGPVEYRGVIDINSKGDLLLDSRMKVSPTGAVHQGPAIWSAGTLRELAVPAGLKDVSAHAIDDDGTVIGRHLLEESFAGERGLLWTPDGKIEELKAPKGFGPAGAPRHLRGGWVVGAFKAPGKPDHEPAELLGSLRSGHYEPAGVTMANAVNRYGWVAGFEREAQRVQIPVIAGDGKRLKLPMPGGARPAAEIYAASISDDGRTVGGVVSTTGDNHAATLWTCRP